jgi:hypothetical protein
MEQSLRDFVRERAQDRCEYFLQPAHFPVRLLAEHQIEHIVARQHRGKSESANRALACIRCNLFKGPNLSGVDPISGETTRLFHPREDTWLEHFRWEGPFIIGASAIGRTTVVTLNMNEEARINRREQLMKVGRFFEE